MKADPIKVLFICSANSARSQMAEALLRKRGGDAFEVHSAGLESAGVHSMTIRALDEIGVDWSEAESTKLESLIGRVYFDYPTIVCAGEAEKCPRLYPSARHVLKWPFDDPAAETGDEAKQLAAFRRVRDKIDARLSTWLEELRSSGLAEGDRLADMIGR